MKETLNKILLYSILIIIMAAIKNHYDDEYKKQQNEPELKIIEPVKPLFVPQPKFEQSI